MKIAINRFIFFSSSLALAFFLSRFYNKKAAFPNQSSPLLAVSQRLSTGRHFKDRRRRYAQIYSNDIQLPIYGYHPIGFALSLHQPQFAPASHLAKPVVGFGEFSDANRWNDTKYYSTIQTVNINGDYYVIARGHCGVMIRKYSNGIITTVSDCDIKFSDQQGWGDEKYYSTIRATAVNGSLYISGRGACGMHIYKLVNDKPKVISLCEIKFADDNGWGEKIYYSTIHTSTANGNLFILGRGSCGMNIYQTWEDKIYVVNICLVPFSDESGWGMEKYDSTINTVSLFDHLYIIGRSSRGIVIYKTLTGKKISLVSVDEIKMSDYWGWDYKTYFSTIYAVAGETSFYIFGRGAYGMIVWRFDGLPLTRISFNAIPFTDSFGWGSPEYYTTIGASVVDEVLYVYGRSSCGMHVYTLTPFGDTKHISRCFPKLDDDGNWNRHEYYSTIQGMTGNGLVLTVRGPCGISIFEQSGSSVNKIVDCM